MSEFGPTGIRAVIFDWAGTIVDHGSRAPMGVFVEAFKRFGVPVSIEEARAPMGLPKWDHIKAVGTAPRVAAAWEKAHRRPFADSDVDKIYEVFVPLNAEIIQRYADIMPGILPVVDELRARGIRIGSTTGYSREITDRMVPIAAAQGYRPDCVIKAGDVPSGRPTPLMMYKCFVELGVWPAAACVKVDDTIPGILEGVSAGSWTVGVTMTGNEVGLSEQDLASRSEAEQAELRARASEALRSAGAHYLIDGVRDLMPVIDDIEARLAAGERPDVETTPAPPAATAAI